MATYYKSDFYEAKLRVENNKTFIKIEGGTESEINADSTIATDIMGANNRITQSEYNQSKSDTPERTSEGD
jgi:hypothetical protein